MQHPVQDITQVRTVFKSLPHSPEVPQVQQVAEEYCLLAKWEVVKLRGRWEGWIDER